MPLDDEEKRRNKMMGWDLANLGKANWSGHKAPLQSPYNPNQTLTPYNPYQIQTPYKPMEEMDTREALETAWEKAHPYGGDVKMTGSLGDFSYYDENLNKPKNDTSAKQTNPIGNSTSYNWIDNLAKTVKWLPEYKTLVSAKQEMDEVNKKGYDNYAHRLGMCRVGQLTSPAWPYSPAIGMGLGILKEGKDLIDKSLKDGTPIKEAFSDSLKDMKNNFEGLEYGLNHPDDDCRKWLEDLDYRRNKWRR